MKKNKRKLLYRLADFLEQLTLILREKELGCQSLVAVYAPKRSVHLENGVASMKEDCDAYIRQR